MGAQYTRLLGSWNETFALNFQRENYEVGVDKGVSNLLVPSAGLERVQADDRIDTTNGYRLRFTLQGHREEPALGRHASSRGWRTPRSIRTLGERNRLIGRAQLGYTATDDFRILPPRFRFFAGGDQSVRGFRYQDARRPRTRRAT